MSTELLFRVCEHLEVIYPDADRAALAGELIAEMGLEAGDFVAKCGSELWNERDVALITYGDSLRRDGEMPLASLHRFCRQQLADSISVVHILPFFPYSSDDGFSIYEYTSVSQSLGSWEHIGKIADDFRLMADVVINHCSSRSLWFENFKQGRDPGSDYFFLAEPDPVLEKVVRPRASALLRPTETNDGIRHVWSTFSHDQVDFDFHNPAVLLEFVRIIRLYLERGVRIFRLDAVAFLWKELGTSCINLPQTHEIIRLLRTLLDARNEDAVIITETNIPNQENLSYFGNGNEAHAIYNFSLPPLLLNALVCGDCHHLKTWMMSMPAAREGSFYLNFIASHDGIGLRPAEGLLAAEELSALLATMQYNGGRISWRAPDESGVAHPYEINISLWDALRGTVSGVDAWQFERFVCAHTVMLALEGLPAFYIHSLLATGNDTARMEHSGHNRHINRHQWELDALEAALADTDTHHAQVFSRLRQLIGIRRSQAAFHPNAVQEIMHLNDAVFAFRRLSRDREQTIICLNNVSSAPQIVGLGELNLPAADAWSDLIGGARFEDEHDCLELAPYQCVWLTQVMN